MKTTIQSNFKTLTELCMVIDLGLFYAVTASSHSISLQGKASEETKKAIESLGYQFTNIGESWISAAKGNITFTLTF